MFAHKHLQALRKARPTVMATIVILVFSLVLGASFFVRGKSIMEHQLKQQMKNIAASSALAFRDVQLSAIQGPDDIAKPVYAQAVGLLGMIRAQNAGVKFTYIFRPTEDPDTFIFVADADSLHPYDEVDLNKDGVIDDSDTLAPPGTPYDTSKIPSITEALQMPVTTESPYTDQWGTYMSGFAPIFDSAGTFQGVLGVDMDLRDYTSLSQSIFSPVAFLLFMFAATAIAGYVSYTVWKRRVDSLAMVEAERAGLLRLTFHQMGGPIAILRWATESLEGKLASIQVEEARLSNDIGAFKEGTARLESILQSLYRANQVHDGNVLYHPSLTALPAVIENVSKDMQGVLGLKKHILSVGDIPDVKITIDADLIAAVIREIIGNASDFSPEGSTITLRCAIDAGFIRIEVCDFGCGIPAKDIPKMFKEFSRASNAFEHKPSGNGLGLYIAKGIIEKAGGKISLVSTEGKGTTVSFTLPLK